jgi:hypothetical protein
MQAEHYKWRCTVEVATLSVSVSLEVPVEMWSYTGTRLRYHYLPAVSVWLRFSRVRMEHVSFSKALPFKFKQR